MKTLFIKSFVLFSIFIGITGCSDGEFTPTFEKGFSAKITKVPNSIVVDQTNTIELEFTIYGEFIDEIEPEVMLFEGKAKINGYTQGNWSSVALNKETLIADISITPTEAGNGQEFIIYLRDKNHPEKIVKLFTKIDVTKPSFKANVLLSAEKVRVKGSDIEATITVTETPEDKEYELTANPSANFDIVGLPTTVKKGSTVKVKIRGTSFTPLTGTPAIFKITDKNNSTISENISTKNFIVYDKPLVTPYPGETPYTANGKETYMEVIVESDKGMISQLTYRFNVVGRPYVIKDISIIPTNTNNAFYGQLTVSNIGGFNKHPNNAYSNAYIKTYAAETMPNIKWEINKSDFKLKVIDESGDSNNVFEETFIPEIRK